MSGRTRRREYRTGIARPDYFVVRHLREFVEASLRKLVQSGMRVADIGCGEQPFRKLAEELGGKYWGMDICQNSSGTVAVVGNVSQAPLASRSFELLICSEVLEHVPDCDAAFGELVRILRPGGHLILTTPFAFPLHEEPRDYTRLTHHKIHSLAQDHLLNVIEFRLSGNELEVIATVWDNLWRHISPPPHRLRLWKAAVRAGMNGGVLLADRLFGRLYPRKYYLNNLFLLQKHDAGDA